MAGVYDTIRLFFQAKLPRYLQNLPFPKSPEGFTSLSREEWIQLAPFIMLVCLFLWIMIKPILSGLFPQKQKRPKHIVNKKVKKEEPKVVDTVQIEDIGDKKAFCRCWKSKNFPYCDGSHNKHNEEQGDNVGPLKIVK
uniref:CDGSH iron-sulfur domain-containing protein 2 homologue n=1 Tax=Halisarca dujardinii TaxID=2583056 RepID=A0A6C0PNC8_HALDU|nr:CDGSH iron-sulfur domain-containing protein 2A-like protein [Halisarca dujardinii]QSX72239.1 CDGSH iron sulfur domain 2 [Halisarca dujardinii]